MSLDRGRTDAVRREGIGGIPSRIGLLSRRWQRQVHRAVGPHPDTKGSCLGGHHCRIRSSGDLRSDTRNVRASSNLLTAETLSSWCYVLKRTFPAGDCYPSMPATVDRQIVP